MRRILLLALLAGSLCAQTTESGAWIKGKQGKRIAVITGVIKIHITYWEPGYRLKEVLAAMDAEMPNWRRSDATRCAGENLQLCHFRRILSGIVEAGWIQWQMWA